jgi:hypothetical protein
VQKTPANLAEMEFSGPKTLGNRTLIRCKTRHLPGWKNLLAKTIRGRKTIFRDAAALGGFGHLQKFSRPPAATNKCLARSNKSCTGGDATKKRTPSMNKEGWSVWPTVHSAPKEYQMRNVFKLLAIAALSIATLTSAAVAEIMPGDKGRWHGYMPSGYIGAHPSNRGVHSCTWSASSYCANWRANGGNTSTAGHTGRCDSTCQTKCQGAWRALGFPSVNACIARWAKLNAEGTARACETAIKANGMRPIRGC